MLARKRNLSIYYIIGLKGKKVNYTKYGIYCGDFVNPNEDSQLGSRYMEDLLTVFSALGFVDDEYDPFATR